jgi:hypothetical protein
MRGEVEGLRGLKRRMAARCGQLDCAGRPMEVAGDGWIGRGRGVVCCLRVEKRVACAKVALLH